MAKRNQLTSLPFKGLKQYFRFWVLSTARFDQGVAGDLIPAGKTATPLTFSCLPSNVASQQRMRVAAHISGKADLQADTPTCKYYTRQTKWIKVTCECIKSLITRQYVLTNTVYTQDSSWTNRLSSKILNITFTNGKRLGANHEFGNRTYF